jgi:hypothetical protein
MVWGYILSEVNCKPVVRGFIPVGLRSSPEISHQVSSDISHSPGLRRLRRRTGINPLTTVSALATDHSSALKF